MSQVLPHNIVSEEALIGRMLTRPDVIGDVCAVVAASDFYQPANGRMFAALADAWATGEPLDPVTLAAALPDLDPVLIAGCVAHATAGHERLSRELVGLRVRRDVIVRSQEAALMARDFTVDALVVLDAAQEAMRVVDAPAESIRDLWTVDAFMDQPATSDPWVIPGLFRAGWRAMLIAVEGAGKSWLSRQIAMAAAAGVHPLCFTPIPPVTTLIVDLENPAGQITKAARRIRDAAKAQGQYDPDRCFLWHRPGGIDLRKRSDRAQLEGAIAQCRPQFVTLGPLYKAYRSSAQEGHELPAGEVQAVLDDLRTRYGFALLLEHHAPKAQGSVRELLPYGSSLWLRWPELGLKLLEKKDTKGTEMTVGRWRADRMENAWPSSISRGTVWPWAGTWDRPYADAMRECDADSLPPEMF